MKNLLTTALLFLLPAFSAVAQTATLTASPTVFSSAGGTITFTATLTYTGPHSALGLTIGTVPAGWSYDTTSGTNVPEVRPDPGTTGSFDFAFISIPASPVSFSFTVTYPAGLTGNQTFALINAVFRPTGGVRVTPPLPDVVIQPAVAPPAVVSVAATDATAGEPLTGQGSGTFTFTRTGATTSALTVNYTVGGTATSDSDYTGIGTTVVIPAGSATATKTVAVIDDALVESNETVVVTLAAGTGYTIGSPSTDTVTIQDDDATVTVAATDPTAGEPLTGQGSGTFTFTRTGFTGSSLLVNYTVGGTATSGPDYAPLGTVSFAAGSSTATQTVIVLDDAVVEGAETLIVTIAPGAYTIGTPASATVTIEDDDASVTVAATDATAGEPLTGQGNGTFTFTRTGFIANALTVNYTVGGTATSGIDYTSIGTSVNFAAGSPTATQTVAVIDDALVESGETVTVTLAAGTGYTIGSPNSDTVTIQDDDVVAVLVSVAATDATAGEPLTSQGTGTFTFSRTGSTTAPLTVNYTVGGTATSGVDYTAIGTTVNFAAGSATATQTVTVIDDAVVEGNETVIVTLAAGTGYTVDIPSSGTVTIQDDDATVTVAATDAAAGEPATSLGNGTFTFTRTGFTTGALTVNYTVGGTATSGVDYTAIGTTVTFAAGSPTATQTVTVIDDSAVESAETVVVTLAAGTGYTVGSPNSDTVTIQDDDATVTVAATDATAGEPATGQGTGTFTFTRTGFTTTALTVNYTVGGTATSGVDYSAIGTTVSFAAGSPTATQTVTVIDDNVVESAETVIVTLAAGTGYAVGSPNSGTVTIQDDDASVTVAATDATAGEPASGQGTGTFTFTRTGFTTSALTVNYTVGGTATSGVDYTAIGTTVTFAAGSPTATQTVTVIDDNAVESAETVIVTLAAGTGYAVGSPSSDTVTIQDDDASVTVAATDATAGEPLTGQGSGTFTFTRTGFTTSALTVNYTVGGTATSGVDYTAIGTTVIFAAGSPTATQTVAVIDDNAVESAETVIVTLAAGTGYTVGSPSSDTVTIQDDDASVAVAATDATAGEPLTGQGTGTFTFTRTGFTANALTVNYTVGGTATSGVDYTSIGTTVSFAAGSPTATQTVNVIADTDVEGSETVIVTLAAGAGYIVGSPSSDTVTIQDDGATVVTVVATDATAGEAGSGQGTGTFTFSRTGSTTAGLTVNYVVTGTATSGVDYTSIGTTVNFAAGSATATQTVTVIEDVLVEGNETVIVTLAAGTGYAVGSPSSGTVTIVDDDVAAAVTVVATDPTAGEPASGQGTGTFTFSRTGPTTAALTVNYTVGGTATSGSDYAPIGTTVTFAAGSSTAAQMVSVIDDAVVESSETVSVSLAAGTGYTVGSPSSAVVTIQDDDAVVVTLGGLAAVYDGTPKAVTVTTNPPGLAVSVTYNGSATPPIYPGAYAVVATVTEPGFSGSASGTLTITITALLRHAPVIVGSLDGSVQMLLGENVSLNGTAMISGDLLVPGTPTVLVGPSTTYGGTLDGPGAIAPAGYSVTLNDTSLLRHTVRRIDPIGLPTVSAPPAPTGTRIVSLTSPGQSPGDFTTLRNLSLNASAGLIVVPAGTYGSFSANGNSGFVLGVAGATVPSVYNFQSLSISTLPGAAQLQIVGPVIVTLANGSLINGATGSLTHPEWLTIRVSTGGLTISGNVIFNGSVVAPTGAVILNGNARLNGTVIADRLTINGTSLLNDPNQ